MKKFLMLSASALLMSSAFSGAVMADDAQDNQDFAKKAAVANMFEIKTSELALQRSKNPSVKDFAQTMITDHTKAGEEMKAALSKSTIKDTALPKDLDEAHQKKFDELKNAEAKDFDERYADIQEDAHDEAVSLFKDYAEDGKDANLKEFAAKTLPTLESHKTHVDMLEDKIDDKDDAKDAPKADKEDVKENHEGHKSTK